MFFDAHLDVFVLNTYLGDLQGQRMHVLALVDTAEQCFKMVMQINF